MRTEQVVYNIIWLDDQIDTLYQDNKIALRDAGIKVLDKGAHDVEEFEHQMNKYRFVVDAVVTDANLNLKIEDDFDGLIDVSYLIEKCNKTRAIPFYVFTGRDNMNRVVNKKTIDRFDGVFEKQKGISPLIDAVKRAIQKVNSKEFRIRKKYSQELEAASLIPGNEECLMNALLYDYSENYKNTQDYFNPMRGIAETIIDKCKTLSVIPPIKELSTVCRFLNKREDQSINYTIIDGKDIMPAPLARSLWFFLDMTQDGSHSKEELKWGVRKYVEETKNINLFRSILHIAMDLCLWFKSVKDEIDVKTYERKWEEKQAVILEEDKIPTRKMELDETIKQQYEKKSLPLERDENGFWHCKECSIAITQWNEGDLVELSDITPNTNSKTKDKYPYFAKYKKVNNKNNEKQI